MKAISFLLTFLSCMILFSVTTDIFITSVGIFSLYTSEVLSKAANKEKC